jgi:hypothetical protein
MLLVRADFVLGNRRGADRLWCKRWRRVLKDALPRLLGCANRCPTAEVCLHDGDGEARYSGWLRIPIERRPSRRRLRKFKAKLRSRLEAGLLAVDGQVIKVGVRRCVPRPAPVVEDSAQLTFFPAWEGGEPAQPAERQEAAQPAPTTAA